MSRMTTPRALAVCLGLASALLFIASPSGIASPRETVSTSESSCYEVAIGRAGNTDAIRQVVPARYDLTPASDPRFSRLLITTYTCGWVVVAGQPRVELDRPTTVTIGSATVRSRDGQPTFAHYLLWYGTDNPVLFAKFHQLGLPVTFQPRTTTAIDAGPISSTIDWAVVGEGVDYNVHAVGLEPGSTTSQSVGTWYYDSPQGDLALSFANDMRPASTATVSADLAGITALQPLLASSSTIQGAPFPYFRGGWTSVLASAD